MTAAMTIADVPVEVTARRGARGWELHVVDEHGSHGVLGARRLSSVRRRVREHVAATDGVDASSVDVQLDVRFGSWLDAEIVAVRAELERVEHARRAATTRSRALVVRLREEGLSGADIAVVLCLSPQRVSQLVKRRGR